MINRILTKSKQFVKKSVHLARLLGDLLDGQRQQTELLASAVQRLSEAVKSIESQTALMNQRMLELRQGLENMAEDSNKRLDCIAGKTLPRREMQCLPLMIDEKTYNTSHPEYDATKVRNYPGKIFNFHSSCKNIVFSEFKRLSTGDFIADGLWKQILQETLLEAKAVPHADQVFERREFIERYANDLERKYGAHYKPGWVNLDDALFLYWLVRRLNPKIIVQTGVCNGLSASFMVLALAKNGAHGKLHAIDLAPVFDPNNPDWTIKDKVYGVMIPEGKNSGWMIPDAYQNLFEVWNGDARELMPKLIDSLDSVDFFYHDSDHTYDHMMFEFQQAMRKMRCGGLVVADDISWNSSLWDFADQGEAPAYNFKGAVGVVCLPE
jgi:predicted O-methyltransferase YrrM